MSTNAIYNVTDGTKHDSLNPPGRSSAWLERMVWDHEVARSNRVAPTKQVFSYYFFIVCILIRFPSLWIRIEAKTKVNSVIK